MAGNPKLFIEVAGDDRALRRTLKQSESRLAQFSRRVSGSTTGTLIGGKGTAGLAVAAGLSAATVALKSTIDAASRSQQVLGQTRVALEDSGLSWEKYGNQVQGAAASLTKLGFDDEETLKVIATFARATGNVTTAIRDTALAADVARARYIDLSAASLIVLKASLGQAGALRRIGIDARKGASGIELLTLLQKKYGGAAQSASNDAATANERLRVSFQNVQEQIGSGLLPIVTNLDKMLADTTDTATGLIAALQRLPGAGSFGGFNFGKAFSTAVFATPGLQIVGIENELRKRFGGKEAQSAATDSGTAFGEAFGLGALTKAADVMKKPPSFGEKGFKVGKAPPVPLGPSQALKNQWFDDAISRRLDRVQDIKTVRGQIAALNEIAGLIQQRINVTKDITRKLTLGDELVQVQRQRRGLEDQLATDAAAKAKKLRDAAKKQADALRKAADTVKKGFADFRKDVLKAEKGDTKEGGPLTATTQISAERILAGLGLGRDVERIVRARLSHFNTRGVALTGAGSGSGATVQVSSTVVVDGKAIAKASSKHQARARKVNPSQRNGPNQGLIVA